MFDACLCYFVLGQSRCVRPWLIYHHPLDLRKLLLPSFFHHPPPTSLHPPRPRTCAAISTSTSTSTPSPTRPASLSSAISLAIEAEVIGFFSLLGLEGRPSPIPRYLHLRSSPSSNLHSSLSSQINLVPSHPLPPTRPRPDLFMVCKRESCTSR